MTTERTDLTWPALLAHWTAFAQASLALPKTAEGDRWRAAVPAIVGLQAVTFALADLDRLRTGGEGGESGEVGGEREGGERALAIDRADMLIRKHSAQLHDLWAGEPLHPEIARMIEDARAALAAAADGGIEWRVTGPRLIAEHPADLLAALLASGFTGDVMLPAPGFALMRGSPAAFCRGPAGAAPRPEAIDLISEFLGDAAGDPARIPGPRQVYRQFDFARGGPVRDVVTPLEATLPAGQPLLVWAMQRGEMMPVPLPPRRAGEIGDLPVVFESE